MIKRQLRESAQAYQPDHERMVERFQRGTAARAVRQRSRSRARAHLRSGPRLLWTALATALALATGGFALAAVVHTFPTPGPTTTPAPSPTAPAHPTASAVPTTASAAPTSAGAAPSASPSSPRPRAAATSHAQSGPLWSAGSVNARSNVYWEEDDVTLRTTAPLTALTVELRIALTSGVQQTGTWRTLPSDDFTVTVQQTGGSLVYRWTLKPGLTVPVGQQMFAAQFNHITGTRSPAGDTYRLDAQGPAGPVSVWGGFTPSR